MNELERIILLPIRLSGPLNILLKEILNNVLAEARREYEITGMVRAVANGYLRWSNELLGIENEIHQTLGAYVRMLAIAIPDLFVVSYDRKAFRDYQLDDSEKQALDAARAIFEAKLSLAKTAATAMGSNLSTLQSSIIRQSPVFNGDSRPKVQRVYR
ncbi:hypothetical protein [Bordetella sp. FB-8]|uniref:hypothetical protein n=1 Tax=Bordetella sp. FB-8 TaxID=1159870 RepID=UPI0003712959|nr:hypothetical protein [Bordetella sp. FB-8]